MCATIMTDARHAAPSPIGEGRVFGLDNVALDLPIAGVGSRVLAGFLDYLAVGALAMVWLILSIMAVGALSLKSSTLSLVAMAIAFLGLFLVEYGYFAGFEIATGGRTPGKMALGLVVVTRQGARASRGALLARNLVRTIDLLVGVPLMAVDATARRLGDRLASTVVVYQNPPVTEAALTRVPQGWGGADVALLESFLRREPELDRIRARRVASQLVAAIRRDNPAYFEGIGDTGDPVVLLRRATQAERP
jgi:uncharacterized RDD family membrane protein YckC